MVPVVRGAPELWRKLPTGGAYVFGEDEIGDFLEEHGFASVRTKTIGTFQWVRGKRG
jgi:arsenite methyltransferase